MTIVAKDLSKACGLHVYADRIWIGGGCIGLGMVFAGLEMGVDRRTPENARKLGKLEQHLKDLKLVADPKLDILCSCSYPPHFEEPFHIGLLTPNETLRADRIIKLTDHWRNQSEPGKGGAKCKCGECHDPLRLVCLLRLIRNLQADDVDLNGEDGERD